MNQNFDPQTGAPIINNDAPQQSTMNFDPLTGAPLNNAIQPEQPSQPENNDYQVNNGYASPVTNYIPTEPVKKSKNPLVIVLLAILAIALIVAAAFFIINKLKGSDRDKVFDGMEATLNEQVNSPLTSYLGTEELTKMISSGSFQEGMSLSLDRLGGNYMDSSVAMVEGIGIQSSCAVNLSEKKYSGNTSITYAGISYLNCDIFAYDDFIALQCPELLDGYFELQTSNLGNDFNNSYIGEISGETLDETLVFNFFDLMATGDSAEMAPNVYNEFESKYKKDFQNAYDDIKVEKTDSKNLPVGDTNQSCKGYIVTVPAESIKTVVKDLCEYINEAMANEALTNEAFASQAFVTEINYDDIKEYLNDDFTFTIYLDKKGRMVMVTQNTEIYDGLVTIDTQLQWSGSESLSDIFAGTILISSMGETYTMNINSTTENKNSISTSNLTVDILQGSTSLGNFTFYDAFDSKTGDFQLSCIATDGYTDLMTLDITGGFENVKAGESFTFTLDDLTLDINGGDYNASLSGDFSIAPLTDTVKSPTGTKYNIFEMTESDITNVATEMMTNVMSSPLGILISDMMYSDIY